MKDDKDELESLILLQDLLEKGTINEDEFNEIEAAVKKDTFVPKIKTVEFDLDHFLKDINNYNSNLIRELYAS